MLSEHYLMMRERLDAKSQAYASCVLIGSSRMRLPVAAKIALQMAGAIGGTPGSPTPAGGHRS